jgi:regulator of protease activity HflC (stomatin/prohibitin superfamily)
LSLDIRTVWQTKERIMSPVILFCLAAVLFVALMLVFASVKIVPEYERGVVFRLGRLVGARGPGLFLLIPVVERMVRVDTRVITLDVPAQEVITLDNVTIKVNAVLYFMVVNPDWAIVKVMDYIRATLQIAQTTLRSGVGQVDLDTLLARREQLNERLQKIIDEQTEPWGVKVTIVEVKDVELPQSMQRAMAKQAEAEREKRAKIIHAAGEFEASKMLALAADVIAREPVTLQLRYLQTLTEIAVEKNSTIIFPLPVDTIKVFLDRLAMGHIGNGAAPSSPPAPIDPAQRAATTPPSYLDTSSASGQG